MASKEKGTTVLVAAGVAAVVFLGGGGNSTPGPEGTCRAQLGLSKVEAVKQSVHQDSPYSRCFDRHK